MQSEGADAPKGFRGPLSLQAVRALPGIQLPPLWDVKRVPQDPVPPTIWTMRTGIVRAEEMASPHALLASASQAPTQRPLGVYLLLNTWNLLLL